MEDMPRTLEFRKPTKSDEIANVLGSLAPNQYSGTIRAQGPSRLGKAAQAVIGSQSSDAELSRAMGIPISARSQLDRARAGLQQREQRESQMQTRAGMIEAQQQAEIQKVMGPAQVKAEADVMVKQLDNLVSLKRLKAEEANNIANRAQALEVLKREGKDVTSPEYRQVEARVLQDKVTLALAEGDIETAIANNQALNDALLEQQKQGAPMAVNDGKGGQRLETPPVAEVPNELRAHATGGREGVDHNNDGKVDPADTTAFDVARQILQKFNAMPEDKQKAAVLSPKYIEAKAIIDRAQQVARRRAERLIPE
jgi:hypothetical protein